MGIFLLFVFTFSFFLTIFIQVRKNKKKKKMVVQEPQEPYRIPYSLYLKWCKEEKEPPVLKHIFIELADENEEVTAKDIISLHPYYFSPEGKAERKRIQCEKTNEQFINSTLIGYMTDSTVYGTLLGGNLWGGMLGKRLKKRKQKE